MVKGYLSLKGVAFEERNVSGDREAGRDLLALGFDATPVAVIGETVVDGFDADRLDQAIASAGSRE